MTSTMVASPPRSKIPSTPRVVSALGSLPARTATSATLGISDDKINVSTSPRKTAAVPGKLWFMLQDLVHFGSREHSGRGGVEDEERSEWSGIEVGLLVILFDRMEADARRFTIEHEVLMRVLLNDTYAVETANFSPKHMIDMTLFRCSYDDEMALGHHQRRFQRIKERNAEEVECQQEQRRARRMKRAQCREVMKCDREKRGAQMAGLKELLVLLDEEEVNATRQEDEIRKAPRRVPRDPNCVISSPRDTNCVISSPRDPNCVISSPRVSAAPLNALSKFDSALRERRAKDQEREERRLRWSKPLEALETARKARSVQRQQAVDHLKKLQRLEDAMVQHEEEQVHRQQRCVQTLNVNAAVMSGEVSVLDTFDEKDDETLRGQLDVQLDTILARNLRLAMGDDFRHALTKHEIAFMEVRDAKVKEYGERCKANLRTSLPAIADHFKTKAHEELVQKEFPITPRDNSKDRWSVRRMNNS